MTALWYVLGAAAGYLLGCVNTAAILARIKGFDIRQKGSGNAGASNALVTMGKGAAVCTAVVDVLKAMLPVLLLRYVIPLPEGCAAMPVVTGAAVILGHIFPFWMQFRGGKGFASLLGLLFALSPTFFLLCIGVSLVILLLTRYIALATITVSVAAPIFWYLRTNSLPETLVLAAVCGCMILKHIENIKRIANGTEIGLRKGISGSGKDDTAKK